MRHATPVLFLAAVLLLMAACKGETPALQYGGYLTDEISPCTPVEGSSSDPCEPDAEAILYDRGDSTTFAVGDEPRSIGFYLSPTDIHVAHLVIRGNLLPGTARCTADQEPFRPASYMGSDLGTFVGTASVKCYVDVRVNEYILGSGPPTMIVLISKRVYDQDFIGTDLEEYWRVGQERWVSEYLATGMEAILFVGPAVDSKAEAWEEMRTWDVERQGNKVVAVHPFRDAWRGPDFQTHRSKLEMEMPAFKTAVMAAHNARVAANGGRTDKPVTYPMLETDANRLTQFFTSIGAYSHANGPPSSPPPSCGLALPSGYNADLLKDCLALLAAKDTLRGTAALNWDSGTAIASWDGVTTAGTPARVTKLVLPSKSLTGTIPADLGQLTGLTHLDLSSNALTGGIPREIGHLDDLVEVRLSGNALTGCIPYGLKDVTTKDLASLNLLYCPPAPETLRGGEAGELTLPLTWDAVANTTKYRVEYRKQGAYPHTWTTDSETITTTSHTVDGLLCSTDYEFRVAAYGNGSTYPAVWSDPSEVLTRATTMCNPPVFSAESYSFSVAEDAAIDTTVGTVSATDDRNKTVTYKIRFWYLESGRLELADFFALDENTGVFTVDQDLDGEAGATVPMTVVAFDPDGGEKEVRVTIEVTAS